MISRRRSIPIVVALLAASSIGASSLPAMASVPATPVMTVYAFNSALDVPYYDVDDFARRGAGAKAAGSLAQGTSLIPCLVIRDGKPLTDASGTPYVGFEIVVDSRRATRASTDVFEATREGRKRRVVKNHHCPEGTRHVTSVRNLHALKQAPFFDPPPGRAAPTSRAASETDAVVRAFHASSQCAAAQSRLIGRRAALEEAWSAFVRANEGAWPHAALDRGRHLDYAMRTAIWEGHLDRGCTAYGACERNMVALSLRNRARTTCTRAFGCRAPGDYQGVSSKVSQYNIWDEYLTQISGLTSCFLRPDLASHAYYGRLQTMYAQSQPDVERILFGDDAGLAALFPGSSPRDLAQLRHYYHPPAMGKCFPGHERLEYMTGAVARRGDDFVLIAGTRIDVGRKRDGGYEFRLAELDEEPDRDVVTAVDAFPGFVVDGRKVALRPSSGCRPYGTPAGCRFESVGRHRKVPSWLSSGRPIQLACPILARDASCRSETRRETTTIGGVCDTQLQPIAGVP